MGGIKRVPTNNVEIRLNANSPLSFFRFGRSPDDEYKVCESIVSQIKRHVDGVGWTHIDQRHVYETEDGNQFDTLYGALDHLYNEHGVGSYFEVRFVRPSDNGAGTRTRPKSFEELIETAYRNPHEFTVERGHLTLDQQIFLNRVLEAAQQKEVAAHAE